MKDEKMERALKMASGEKIRDDVKRLKKTKKSLEKQKEKSRQKWMDREHEKSVSFFLYTD